MKATNQKGHKPKETTMKKLVTLLALTLALAAGTATMITIHPQPAVACVGNGC
jgi:hypothetical protein